MSLAQVVRVVVPVALVAWLLLSPSTPSRYEVRRLAAAHGPWHRCAPGPDGEERMAAWCPSRVVFGADSGLPPETRTAQATFDASTAPSGPVVLVQEAITYAPVGVLSEGPEGNFATRLRHDPKATLLDLGHTFPLLRVHGHRRALRLAAARVPLELPIPLPRGKRGRNGAWAVWGWSGGRASERVDLAPLTVPPDARLAVSFAIARAGLIPGSPPVTFRVETAAGDRLWEQRIDPAGSRRDWHDAEIDLSAHAGASIDLRLLADVDGDADAFSYPVWGQPRLLVPLPREQATRPNVILISLDTLRGDYLSFAGHPAPTTPALDAFAAEGVAFLNAFSTFPSTGGSHMSMLTSLHPCAHRVTLPDQRTGLSLAATTVAEAFAGAGWSTAAITEDGFIRGDLGYSRGFDRYIDQSMVLERPLGYFPVGIERALDWIATEANRPFFLFLHTYQPHNPYKVPPHLRDRFPVPPDATEMDRLRIDYEAGIRYTDELLDGFLRTLRARGLMDDTLIAITSDHGEAFGERGSHGHGQGVFDEQLHVPLVFRHPGLLKGGRRIDAPTSLIDLAPTLLDAAGIASPESFKGRSVLPLARGDREAPSPSAVFGENFWSKRQTMYRTRQFSWIVDGDTLSAYAVDSDPGQQKDLIASQPLLRVVGTRLLEPFRKQCEDSATRLQYAGTVEAAALDPSRVETLRALGYME